MANEGRKERARRGLIAYFAALLVGSGICEGLLVRTHDPITEHPWLVLANMWVPAIASIVARVLLREGVRDVSFRFGAARTFFGAVGKAWAYPLVVGFAAYGLAWATGLATFWAPGLASLGLATLSPTLRFLVLLAITSTIGVFLSALSAAGEELGWRGYMLTRLVDAGVPRPALVSGLIWGFWHVPLIVTGQYASGPHPFLSAGLFLLSIVAASYVVARLRLESGSVWPAVAFHSAWNSIIQGAFDGSTVGGSATNTTSIWIGESGVLVVLANVLLAASLTRGPWNFRRSPSDPPTNLPSAP